MVVRFSLVYSQVENIIADSISTKLDLTATDTINGGRKISPEAIEKPITHTAAGYRRADFVNKKVYLVDNATVTYGDITLKADSIVLNMETSVVFASGRRDTTGQVIGKPVFQRGSETFDSDSLTYNFKTEKGIVFNMATDQEDGYLRSGLTKRLDNGSLNINKSTYSTCELEHPHFYVGFNKARVIPDKKIITGPAYLVLEDIPLPIVLPFGFFPIQKKEAASGLIIPKIGTTYELGYSLREGGYYFAISEYFDLQITGNLYTNGTWMLNASSSYARKYKYSGRVSLSYANNISGHKGLPDYGKSTNYRIDWTYSQDPKASPGSRFSASVNMSSSEFDRTNSYIAAEHVNTQRQSSISYSKTWEGTPFNFSTSLNHSQDVRTKTIRLNLPKATFSMSRIYPLKGKNRVGPTKWYQELQFQYTASVDNQISSYDSLLFTREVFNNMKNGFKHDIPVSLQIRPFKRAPGFTISPQLSYSGVLYTQKYEQRWVTDYYDPDRNQTLSAVVKDTIRGFFYGQSVNASVSTGLSPQIYGTYLFKNPESRLKAIRHIIKPSVSFSYVPVLKGLTTDMFRQVQVDTLGNMRQYSIFDGNLFGTPSVGRRSGGLNFSLVNIVEAKVLEKNDTTGEAKKVKIIENLTMNTSYNIFGDSLRWAPVSMSYRTVLFGSLNMAAGSSFSLYGLDKNGRIINTFYYSQTRKPLRLTNASISFDFDLGNFIQKKKKNNVQGPSEATAPAIPPTDGSDITGAAQQITRQESPVSQVDDYGYTKFDMPWTLNLTYSINYSRPLLNSTVSQTLALRGTLDLTNKMKINYTTGYDIARREITMTNIGITRDLHCWDMSFDWIPTGYMKSWYFTIKVKAAVLADLKYERRKDFHDQY